MRPSSVKQLSTAGQLRNGGTIRSRRRGSPPAAVLSKADMLERIEEVRRRGYAVAVDERFMGVSAVAAPIVNGSKMVAAA